VKKYFFALLLLLFINLKGFSQKNKTYSADAKIPVAQLRADFKLMRQAFEEGHPALYWYTPKEKMDKIFDSTYKQLDKDMTELEFYKVLSPLVTSINCGHTGINTSVEFEKYYMDSVKTFPFRVFTMQDRLFVKTNRSADSTLKRGTEILSINNIPVADIIKTFIANTPMDGYNQTGKYRYAEVRFGRNFNYFIGQADTFKLDCVLPDGQYVQTQVPALSLKNSNKGGTAGSARLDKKVKRMIKESRQVMSMKISEKDPATAVMTLKAFPGVGYRKFFKKSFKEIEEKGIRNLVIDLRENPGGFSIAALTLYSYLNDSTFRYYNPVLMKKKRFSFKKNLNQRLFLAFNAAFAVKSDRKNGVYTVKIRGAAPQKPARKYNFDGEVYILTSGFTASAAALFTANAHYHKRAVVIGEETGGGYVGCTAGIVPYLTLPNSKLRVSFPVMKITNAMTGIVEGRGTIPDHDVPYTVEDFSKNVDTQMEYTIKLIQEGKQLSDQWSKQESPSIGRQ
jgi:C-terminal processing protease CtpA/Prc